MYRSFENHIYSLVYDNELKDNNGNPTGFTITTPDDLWKASPGMVIAVCGVEWLCCTDKWISCYGATMDDEKMFVHISATPIWFTRGADHHGY